jgi:hypothetical protein
MGEMGVTLCSDRRGWVGVIMRVDRTTSFEC